MTEIRHHSENVVLASASRARAAMLEAAGVTVSTDPARIDEAAIKSALAAEMAPARDVADKLAEMKALRISARHPGKLVLGADQVLVLGDRIFDKPSSIAEAKQHLLDLRGKPHILLSAAVMARDGQPAWRHIGQAQLMMRPFSEQFLDRYLEVMEDTVTETVGGYQIEGLGSQLFSRVQGDYFTVLGLPLLEVLGYLRAQEVLME